MTEQSEQFIVKVTHQWINQPDSMFDVFSTIVHTSYKAANDAAKDALITNNVRGDSMPMYASVYRLPDPCSKYARTISKII